MRLTLWRIGGNQNDAPDRIRTPAPSRRFRPSYLVPTCLLRAAALSGRGTSLAWAGIERCPLLFRGNR